MKNFFVLHPEGDSLIQITIKIDRNTSKIFSVVPFLKMLLIIYISWFLNQELRSDLCYFVLGIYNWKV